MREKFQSLYQQLIFRCKESKNRIYLYIISFLESIIFPLPTDIFLIPFVLAKKIMLQGDPRIEKPTLQVDCFGVQMV